jgi:hypothetical protein
MAILAISAADLFRRSNHGRPHGSCRSLWNRLPLKGRLTLGCQLLISLFDDLLYLTSVNVPSELRVYHSRMDGGSAHPAAPVPSVEGYLGRLGSSISNERFIGCALKVGILEVDIGIAVTQSCQNFTVPRSNCSASFSDGGQGTPSAQSSLRTKTCDFPSASTNSAVTPPCPSSRRDTFGESARLALPDLNVAR